VAISLPEIRSYVYRVSTVGRKLCGVANFTLHS